MTGVKAIFGAGVSALALAAISAGTASAQVEDGLTTVPAETNRNIVATGADARGRIRNHLRREGFSEDAISTLELTREWAGRNGRRHMEFEQRIGGKRVVGSLVRASVDAQGRPMTISRRLSNGNRVSGANALTAAEAVSIAAALHHEGAPSARGRGNKNGHTTSFEGGSFFHVDPTAEEVIVANRGGRMEPGWLVTTWTEEDNQLIETVFNARGKVISTQNRTAEDSYNIYPDHPGVTAQTLVTGPGSGNTESPIGWLGTGTQYATLISGNNARAYLDRDNNNGPDSASTVVSDGNFDTVGLLNQSPTVASNQEVAIQNLFYFNNVIHDELYRHGFTEATRNFQENNFGKGGSGSDSVNAEGQDGGGTNNANFATPSDGSNPRMQMYLWTYTNPGRDGDLDSDIIWHEYGHGLTWRMIGSMSGSISGAIGEGMSDVLAIIMNDDDRVGEYSTDDVNGIRRYRYEGYPLTLGDFTGNSVHSDGEIYAATLWDMKKRYYGAGLSRDDIMGDIIDGMNFTPAGPDYLDMRNGILDAAASDRDCLVWESFAAFGMGEGASMGTKGRRITVTESFAVPSSCQGGGTTNEAPVADFTYSCTELSCTFTDGSSDDSGVVSFSWDFGDGAGSSSQNPSHSYGSDGTYTVSLTVTDAEGLSDTTSQSVSVAADGGDPGGSINLSTNGYKNKGRHVIDLNWSGSSAAVDIFRNGSKIVTGTANDGFYTDNTGNKGGATYTYEVCETGTTTCSNSSTVAF